VPLTDEQAEYVEGLHELATFLAGQPELINKYNPIELRLFPPTEAFPSAVRALGTAEKFTNEWWVGVRREFGPHSFRVCQGHEAAGCEKTVSDETVTVTRTGTAEELPPGAKVTGVLVQYEVEEPEVIWVCPESFLAP